MNNREKFKRNLIEAVENHDGYCDNDEVNKFLDLNYDEDSSLNNWTYGDFDYFARSIAAYGFWQAAEDFDFVIPDKVPEEEVTYDIIYIIDGEEISESGYGSCDEDAARERFNYLCTLEDFDEVVLRKVTLTFFEDKTEESIEILEDYVRN